MLDRHPCSRTDSNRRRDHLAGLAGVRRDAFASTCAHPCIPHLHSNVSINHAGLRAGAVLALLVDVGCRQVRAHADGGSPRAVRRLGAHLPRLQAARAAIAVAALLDLAVSWRWAGQADARARQAAAALHLHRSHALPLSPCTAPLLSARPLSDRPRGARAPAAMKLSLAVPTFGVWATNTGVGKTLVSAALARGVTAAQVRRRR